MQPLSREQLNRNRYLRSTSFEGKQDLGDTFRRAKGDSDSVRDRAISRDRNWPGAMAPLVDDSSEAAQTNGNSTGKSGLATSKKHKRKSKQTNGTDGNGTNGLGHPDSYVEAVKQDPADVEKREAQEMQAENEKQSEDASQNDGAGDAANAQATPAGEMTFAEAVKETPANGDENSKADGQGKPDTANVKTPNHPTPAFSQASTSNDYPEIQSDEDDEQEEKQRRQDKEKASQVLGTRWAPVRVPFKRRLQTGAVLMHCLGIGLSLSIFFFFCAFPPFWPIIIIYLFTILFATDATDGKLKKRKEWVRRLPIWTFFAEYFPARLHKTHDLQPTRKYILGYHPHGIISHGAWAAFATEALGFSEKFPGITNSLLTLDSNFQLPLYREYVFSMGALSVSRESITNILTHGGPNNEGMGRAVTIVVGGARESLEAQPNTMRLIINERKGFVKLALQTGADLVPVIAFGENDLYDQLDPHRHPWLHGLQRYFLKAWKFTVPLLHGRGIFNYDVGLMPYRRPLNIVVGKPIPVVQNQNPENSEVNRLHDLYTEELQKVWDRYKDEFLPHRKEEVQFLS